MTLGLVCDACDTLSALNATVCAGCGVTLGITRAGGATAAAAAAARGHGVHSGMGPLNAITPAGVPGGTPAAVSAVPRGDSSGPHETAPAEGRPCSSCGAIVATAQKFCGECGSRVPDAPGPALPGTANKTLFFSAMQAPGRAKLILIKGEGMDGVSYHLAGAEHIAGRLEGAILFPEDPLLSPRHADFYYRDGRLIVRDETSHNGVFIRIKGPVIVEPGASFLVGEQLLRVEASAPDGVPIPDEQGTYFYGSPKRPARMSMVQLLAGGDCGMIFRARSETIAVGREGNDVNFPNDPFISGRHAAVTALDGGRFQLADLGSRNGTFLRVRGEASLSHGDYVFLGQQLLRVEIT